MATLTLESLPELLRQVAEMIDHKRYFSLFDEDELHELASAVRTGVVAPLGESADDLRAAKTKLGQTAAGELHRNMYEGFAKHADEAVQLVSEAEARAAKLDQIAEKARDLKARFFEIVLIHWARAQFYGCKNPASLDALLLSKTTWVLDDARRSWDGLVERYGV